MNSLFHLLKHVPLLQQQWQEKNTDKYIDFFRDINGKIDVTSTTIQLSVVLTREH